jgi:abortive infection bacteriophage resistance protein
VQYNKPAISLAEQVALLRKRGLHIADEEKAIHYLSNISYYRLRAYTYPFQNNQSPDHEFLPGASLEQVIDLYVFDRKLRFLVFDALEKIEIALRTKIIYHYAIRHGSHWHEDFNLFRDRNKYVRDMGKLIDEIGRSSEIFIKHYRNKYSDPENPPAWMSFEVISLGMLSKMFENLRKSPEKLAIVNGFGLTGLEVLESWMHTFAHIRNICAHHGRLWNRRLTTTPKYPAKPVYPFIPDGKELHANKLYLSLACMSYLLNIISPGHTFNSRLKELIKSYPFINQKEMGFPLHWEKDPLWK